jgi:hypothetical protein
VPQHGVRLSRGWAKFCDRIDARMRDPPVQPDTLLLGPRHQTSRGR